jgi:exonuclease III
MRLRVTTFNANNQAAARTFLQRRVRPDVVLLQEARAAHWPTAMFPVATLEGRGRESATAIDATAGAIERLSHGLLGRSAPRGTIAAALVRTSRLSFTAVSIYAQINDGRAYPTAHRIVDDLENLLGSPAAERLILGGDFNAYDQYGDTSRGRSVMRFWRDLWTRLDRLGLINLLHATRASRPGLDWCACGLADECWHVPTVRRMRRGRPAQCDYLFASRWFAERLQSCEVIDIMDPELVPASDHAPVTATFLV